MNYSHRTSAEKFITGYLLPVVFIIYVLLLSKYILFTRVHTSPENYFSWRHVQTSISKGMGRANLKPFYTIKLVYYGKYLSTGYRYKNLGGNLFGFVPLGIFLPLLFRRLRSFPAVIVLVFAISLAYELIQLCTGLGTFDVDDLILNTAGGMIGYMTYFCTALIYRQPPTKTGAEA